MRKAVGFVIAVLLFAVLALAQCPQTVTCPWEGREACIVQGSEHQIYNSTGCKWVATYECPLRHRFERFCN
jgi:hypothetical protein